MKESIVVIPTYNEIENVEEIICKVFSLPVSFDVLIIDDGSPDGTAAKVKALQQRYPDRLHLLERTGKQGLGTAYIHGFKYALEQGYKYIFEMDADFSHNPEKMRDILLFWARKGVDGFRCDMAEMVPVEFWNYVIPQVQEVNKDIIFIAEIYNPAEYRNYIEKGKFTYLYDKVGLYDSLKAVIQNRASARDLSVNWKHLQGINSRMLRFLENHDEQRIASEGFAGDAHKGIPAMMVSATLNSGPVMIYFGQEVGEPGRGVEGFGGEDGRTTIFDYWGVPQHQKWLNGGAFDGALLSQEQKQLRAFYNKLLNICTRNEAIQKGNLYDLQMFNAQHNGYDSHKTYAYLRYTDKQKLLIVVNFDEAQAKQVHIKIPANAFAAMNMSPDKTYQLQDILLSNQTHTFKPSEVTDLQASEAGISLQVETLGAYIFTITEK